MKYKFFSDVETQIGAVVITYLTLHTCLCGLEDFQATRVFLEQVLKCGFTLSQSGMQEWISICGKDYLMCIPGGNVLYTFYIYRSAVDDREGLVTDYLDLPLPVNWSDLSLYDRQDYVQSQGLLYSGGDIRRRDYVSNIEIWCECFGKDKADFQHKNSFEISAIMARIDGWEKTGKTMWLPIYGKQRVYRRKSETSSLKQTMERSTEQTI